MNIRLLQHFSMKNNLGEDISDDFELSTRTNPLIILRDAIYKETQGEYNDTEKLSNYLLSQTNIDKIIEFGAKTMNTFCEVRLRPTKELRSVFLELDEILNSLDINSISVSEFDYYNYHFISAIYFTVKSTYEYYNSNYNDAVIFNKQAIENWMTIEETDGVNLVSIDMQFCLNKLGRFDEALKLSIALLSRIDEKGDPLTYCHNLLSSAETYKLIGKYQSAAEILKKALTISKELEIEVLYFHTSMFLSEIYSMQGLYDLALDLQVNALEYFKRVKNPLFYLEILNDLGHTCRRRHDYEQAKVYFNDSLQHASQLENCDSLINTYFGLILTEVSSTNDTTSLLELQGQIEEKAHLIEDQKYSIIPKLVNAIILQNQSRLDVKYRSLSLFHEIISDTTVYSEYRLIAIYYLIDLLIQEYNYTSNDQIIDEIQSTLEQMLQIGSETHSYSVLIDYHLLMFKFQRELKNPEQMAISLEEAKLLAKLSQDKDLMSYLSLEEELITNEVNYNSDIGTPKVSQIDQFSSLSSHLLDLKHGRQPTYEEKTFSPSLIMILSEGGTNLFSMEFVPSIISELNLVASFLSAMFSFTHEVFNKSSIELIKFGTQNMILHILDNLIICLMHSGYTPAAISILKEFASRLEEIPSTMINLKHSLITKIDHEQISEIVGNMFSEYLND